MAVFRLHGLKVIFALAMIFGLAAGVLSSHQVAQAQDSSAQTFFVQAGAAGPANMDALVFAPAQLQVHRGDTITWLIAGFHNMHIEPAPSPLVIVQEVNGVETPILNPAIPFPSAPSGSVFTGGEANSGLPLEGPPLFSLVIDAEPGVYSYFCDIHPGMGGTFEVVADDVAIPGPQDVLLQAFGELGAAINAGFEAYGAATATMEMASSDGSVTVLAGTGVETTINMFLAPTVTIHPGDTVNWVLNDDSREIHTITWPPRVGEEFFPIEQEAGPPILVLGPALAPETPSGSEIGADGMFQGIIAPGETYSLTFTEPGVYPYICNLHPGMGGTVVVMPAM